MYRPSPPQTADADELDRKASQCDREAQDLDHATATLRAQVEAAGQRWTGQAYQSLRDRVTAQMNVMRDAANELRDAAAQFRHGAHDIREQWARYRDALHAFEVSEAGKAHRA